MTFSARGNEMSKFVSRVNDCEWSMKLLWKRATVRQTSDGEGGDGNVRDGDGDGFGGEKEEGRILG